MCAGRIFNTNNTEIVWPTPAPFVVKLNGDVTNLNAAASFFTYIYIQVDLWRCSKKKKKRH